MPLFKTKVLGAGYNNVEFSNAVNVVDEFLQKPIKKSVFFLNADYLYKAQKDAEYRNILNSNDLVLPDGIGLKIISAFLGSKMLDNCNGTDFSPVVLGLAARKGLSVYFLGSKEGVACKAAELAVKQFPGLKIAGVNSGYFDNNGEVIARVNASGADILLVGMGAPLQEKWIHKYRSELNPRLCMAVGAYFDFLSGYIPRAPKILICIHLEWLWRVLVEPRRMIKRYFVDGVSLFGLVFKYKIERFFLRKE